MSATVTREDKPPYHFIAWCEACQEGIKHHRPERAASWADGHNAAKHLAEMEAAADAKEGKKP